MAASALAFEKGSIGINQILAVKTTEARVGDAPPRTRTALLS